MCWIASLFWLAGWMVQAAELPAGTLAEVRLRSGLHSYSAQVGQKVEAVVAAPVMARGKVALPAGSLLTGWLVEVKRVGLGLRHERASLRIEFETLAVDGAAPVRIRARMFGIENAREKLDERGRVRGIRSTNTPGFRAAGVLTGLAAVDPIALLFSASAFGATLRFSDPEIDWRPGAELVVELREAVETGYGAEARLDPVARDDHERAELVSLVKAMPHRTARMTDLKPSDLTNVMLIGKPESIARAFAAAGWVESVETNASTRYRSLRAFAETQPYQEAPMSALTLDGKEAVLTLSKTLNTFTRRHHLRLYAWRQSWDGLPVFQAAATHDTDIVMSLRQRTITHEIDSNIDEERAKVVNDLLFTGCIDGAEWVARPWVEGMLRNGSGQRIETDRAIAVLKVNECEGPSDAGVVKGEAMGGHGTIIERGVRQAVLRLRNDVLRGNLVWQGASWAYRFSQMLRKKDEVEPRKYARQTLLGPVDLSRRERSYDASLEDGSSLIGVAEVKTASRRSEAALGGRGDWGTPSVELGFQFGGSLFCQSTVGEEAWIFTTHHTAGGAVRTVALTAGNQIRPGWAMGGTVTVHGNRWVSHELGFHYLRGSYLLGLQKVGDGAGGSIPGLVEQRAGLLTRQFSYSTVVHLRPLEARLRPYVAAGPALQLVHLTNAPFQGSKGIFRLGLSNVGLIRAAYNFGSAPPLDGGGIFQPAVQMGGGVKYRFRNCWMLRLDYRNTFSHRPDLLRKSLAPIVGEIEPLQNTPTHKWFAQQRVSVGLSFTF